MSITSFADDVTEFSDYVQIEEILSLHHVQIDQSGILYLKDASSNDRYIYMQLENIGYIIYDKEKAAVVEYSVESDNKS